ncbi:hypothetical protein [Nocardiopsis tropica]|uniref:ATP-grasp domain-containing protein n=1 Tax=Nocardiopsis tropica TaxID=109330 RepID=A0ABU7KSK5_9ACTN|nr:hypothetical protein [Nocardiopsis umidischolae]MEE2052283.1 hypothetical protein [Nocardiopsis umidischolae]
MNRIALVTDEVSLPIDYDMPPLLDAFREIGVEARTCSWDDPGVHWAGFDAVLLRSPWSYVERLPEFLSWCEDVTALTQLLNPLAVSRWSLDKHYMADLAAHGVPVVPSRFVVPGTDPVPVWREFLAEHSGTAEVVVKPTVGAYSKDVQRFARSSEPEATHHISHLLDKGHHVLLQPYVASVDEDGETDLVYFSGVYSHAIRKSAMLMPDGTVNVPTFESRRAREATADERAVASAVLDAAVSHLGLQRPLLYARVDLIRGADRSPIVLEMELCEPSLNLLFAEGSALRFARAVAEHVKS